MSESKPDYFQREEVSNSDLTNLRISPKTFLMKKQGQMNKSSKALELGTLIHRWNLEPELFALADVEPVTGKMGKYIQAMSELTKGLTLDEKGLREMGETAYMLAQFKASNAKITTVFKSFTDKPENQAYYNFLLTSDGKILMTQQDKNIVEGCSTSLRSHVVANKLVFGEDLESHNEVEVYFQQHGVMCRSKLDRVVVDHANKKVTLVDLKTSSKDVYGECTKVADTGFLTRDYHATGFMFSCLMYSYYRQIAFYENALRAEYPGYEIESFLVAISTSGTGDIAVYKMPAAWVEEGQKQIESTLNEYKKHQETQVWDVKAGFEGVVTY